MVQRHGDLCPLALTHVELADVGIPAQPWTYNTQLHPCQGQWPSLKPPIPVLLPAVRVDTLKMIAMFAGDQMRDLVMADLNTLGKAMNI